MAIAHDEREALRMLADSPNGSTESIMLTHGFAIGTLAQWARDRGAADRARGAAANQGDVDDDYGCRAAGARRVEGRLGPAHVEDAGGAPSRLRRRARAAGAEKLANHHAQRRDARSAARICVVRQKRPFDRSDRIAIVDDTPDSEFGHLGMSREQCIHALRRTLPTRCEVWHWFMTLEVLAADRKHD
jgi:hypothetical protein